MYIAPWTIVLSAAAKACCSSPSRSSKQWNPSGPTARRSQRVILLSAQGRKFTQQVARELSASEELLLICGRYEGVDERVAEHLADDELSIGDYVLSGGELAAAVVVDTVARLLPGVFGNEDSSRERIFHRRYSRLPAVDPSRRFPRLESA